MRGRSWALGHAQSLSCAGDGVGASEVDTLCFWVCAGWHVSPLAGNSLLPNGGSQFIGFELCSVLQEDPDAPWQ